MPELPEVETTCAGIRPHLLNSRISNLVVRETRLRWPVDKDLKKIIEKKKLFAVTRRAKYILLHLEKNKSQEKGILVIHLGMSGSLRILDRESEHRKHDHIDINFNNGKLLRFHDPRRFGAVIWIQDDLDQHKLFKHLGPEPLSEQFSGDYLYLKSRKRKLSVKQFIMDAQVVVGVGNIYANEALFASGIHPNRDAGSLSKKSANDLVDEIKQILSLAITRGGTTLKDFENPEGNPGYFSQNLKVYGRKGAPCPKCQNNLKEIRLNNRTTVFCPKCQK
jgi:formamidopyrimidine-DNA glycosylase